MDGVERGTERHRVAMDSSPEGFPAKWSETDRYEALRRFRAV